MHNLPTNDPYALGWLPHKPSTWTHRIAKLRAPTAMRLYTNGTPEFVDKLCPAGTRVKIVMVSRFGDVGVTEDLTADVKYTARVTLDELCDFEPGVSCSTAPE